MSNQAYPLQWPIGRPRWPGLRQSSQFRMTEHQMQEHLFDQLDKLRTSDVVVSTNRQPYSRSKAQPEDPGVVVYFTRKGQELAIACDKYRRVEDNLHAIGIALESIRTLERHGTGDMVDAAFTGFTALPETAGPSTILTWYETLGVSEFAPTEEIRQAFRDLSKTHHPDVGGDAQEFQKILKAYQDGLAARRG